jgi:hypothetical protein
MSDNTHIVILLLAIIFWDGIARYPKNYKIFPSTKKLAQKKFMVVFLDVLFLSVRFPYRA